MADPLVPSSGAHDAAAGFHDIKPLPEFSPFPWDFVWAGVGILALALLAAMIFRRRSRTAAAPPAPPLSPLEEALAALRELELARDSQRIALRDLCSQLSLTLRVYLERMFFFPAAEQTTAEVVRALPERIRSRLPILPKERGAEMTAQIRAVLRFLEAAAFSGESTERYHLESEEVRSMPARIESLVRELDTQFRREDERTRSVMDGEVRP